MEATIKSIFENLTQSYDPAEVRKFKILIDAEDYVWDYKVQNGELRLIYGMLKVVPEVEKVTLGEIMEKCSEGLELPIVSESTGLPFSQVELVEAANIAKEVSLMINFKTGTIC